MDSFKSLPLPSYAPHSELLQGEESLLSVRWRLSYDDRPWQRHRRLQLPPYLAILVHPLQKLQRWPGLQYLHLPAQPPEVDKMYQRPMNK